MRALAFISFNLLAALILWAVASTSFNLVALVVASVLKGVFP